MGADKHSPNASPRTASGDVSITIPAYNEEKRIGPFLDKLIEYCDEANRDYEVLVVDDGSTDGTSRLVDQYRSRYRRLVLLREARNLGKGAAVKRGLLHSKRPIRVFMDADGSYSPEEIDRHLSLFQDGSDLIIGNRYDKASVTDYHASFTRRFLQKLFQVMVRLLLFEGIKDSQSGFKMMKGEVADRLLPMMRSHGFGFDLELIFLARKHCLKISSVPVRLFHHEGSSVHVFRDALKLFVNIFQIRMWHFNR